MVELFEQDIKKNERQSSKGNQLKWENNGVWYKADYTGYEGLSEYVISHLLKKSTLSENFFGESLYKSIYLIGEHENRLHFLINQVERMTGLQDFGIYLNKLLTLDAFFLNEDRHTHNIAVLMNEKGEFAYCPIFDNGAGLLADTMMDYPLGEDTYTLMRRVQAKTICSGFDEQLDISEMINGENIKFHFTEKDVRELLESVTEYSQEEKRRVESVICMQMKKYGYLFS